MATDQGRLTTSISARSDVLVAPVPKDGATLDGLADLGITTRLLAGHDRATGRFQAVVRDGDRLVGVVDPRGSGVAAGRS